MNVTYQVKKSEQEGGEDAIVKSGHSYEFFMSKVTEHMLALQKGLHELKAQIELEDAKLSNVKSFHPVVDTLSDEDMASVVIYFESKKIKEKCLEKKSQIEAALAEYKTETEDILKQTGIAWEFPAYTPPAQPEVASEAPKAE